MLQKVNILECTLRDGSYPIEYQFSADDTAIIAAALENAGFNFIEIGHGLGLGASSAGEGVAAATDEEYLKAASSVLKRAQFGTFFIPGIGNEEHLRMAADHGMGFVRIGTNAPEVEKAENYIKLAKKLGMTVTINLMKSYSLKPPELAKRVKIAKDWGADIAYVVDSAGGMLPREVSEYVKQIRAITDIAVGFHGHNNFGLAVANTLAAIESGATFVDCTLQGIGRSAGNAPTEILVMILEKLGYKTGIAPLKVMNIGESFIKPMMKEGGISSIDVIGGYALFHSKFLEKVYTVADKFELDPRELIINTSKSNLLDVPEGLLISVAEELSKKRKRKNSGRKFASQIAVEIDNVLVKDRLIGELAKEVCKKLSSVSKKNGKTSVFTIASSYFKKSSSVSPFIRESDLFVIGNSVVTNQEDFGKIISEIDDKVDIILIDDEMKNSNTEGIYEIAKALCKKSRIYSYSDEDLLARICAITIFQIAKDIKNKKIAVFGSEILGNKLSIYLAERGAKVFLCDEDLDRLKIIVNGLNLIKSTYAPEITLTSDNKDASKDAEILVGTTHNKPIIMLEAVKSMLKGGFLFDAGIGSVHGAALEYAVKMGINTYRPDMKAGLSGEILSILETDFQITSILGKAKIGGVSVVAGGIFGRKGDVIIDSISNPTTVLGIADGSGGFVQDMTKYLEKIEKVKSEMMRRKMALSLERAQGHNEALS